MSESGEYAGVALVDAHIAKIPSPQRETLQALRSSIRAILPHADEGLKYGMPAFLLDGKGVAGYEAFKNHCGYFPLSGPVLDEAGPTIAGNEQSKGGIRFGIDEPLTVGLVRPLVKLRIVEISNVANGRRCEYFGGGQSKAAGQMKNGLLHDAWQWFRSDGTLMRTGQFSRGKKIGVWATQNRDGTISKTTQF